MKNRDNETSRNGGKYVIPNFVGISGAPCFPPSEAYARHSLIVYRPWREYPQNGDWVEEFERFVHSRECPISCRMAYERVMLRHYHKMTFHEPKTAAVDHSINSVEEEDNLLMMLSGRNPLSENDPDAIIIQSMNRGIYYDWGKDPKVSFCDIMEKHPCFDFDPVKSNSWLCGMC